MFVTVSALTKASSIIVCILDLGSIQLFEVRLHPLHSLLGDPLRWERKQQELIYCHCYCGYNWIYYIYCLTLVLDVGEKKEFLDCLCSENYEAVWHLSPCLFAMSWRRLLSSSRSVMCWIFLTAVSFSSLSRCLSAFVSISDYSE